MKPDEIADLIEASGHAFENVLTASPREVASWHPKPGEWCVNECVGHVIEADKRGFAGRIRILLASDEPTLETWDQVAVAKSRDDCHREPADLRREFHDLRAQSVELLRSLRPEQLTRAGSHPKVGRLTIDEVAHEWVHHDGNHLRQALANVQAYVWPQMGNAQRFSQPTK